MYPYVWTRDFEGKKIGYLNFVSNFSHRLLAKYWCTPWFMLMILIYWAEVYVL